MLLSPAMAKAILPTRPAAASWLLAVPLGIVCLVLFSNGKQTISLLVDFPYLSLLLAATPLLVLVGPLRLALHADGKGNLLSFRVCRKHLQFTETILSYMFIP